MTRQLPKSNHRVIDVNLAIMSTVNCMAYKRS